MMAIVEDCLARLGWITRCAYCKRRLPYGPPKAHCHACKWGYVKRKRQWVPHDRCVACEQPADIRFGVGGGLPGWYCEPCYVKVQTIVAPWPPIKDDVA